MNKYCCYLLTLFLIVLVCLTYPAQAQQTIENRINAIENEMSQLRKNYYDLLSPTNFKDAEEELAKAKKDFQEGKDIRGIQDRLEKAGRYLKLVNDIGKQGEILFKDVLEARNNALEAQAPDYASQEFTEAENKFLEASGRLEKGDLNGARDRIPKILNAYQQAEFVAIKESIVGANCQIKEGANVQKNAPRTMKKAQSLYDEVLLILNGNRYAKTNAREIATQAAYEVRHAMYLNKIIEELKKDDKNWEILIHNFEANMDSVASQLGFEGEYDTGFQKTENDIILAIQNLKEENKTLKEDLNSLQTEDEALRQKIQQYEKTVVSELEKKKEREEKLKKIEKIFTRDEAQVLLSENQLIIRLYGLTFASGSTTITPEHFMLLTKVMRALREFPNHKYLIAGHTDSQGNDAYNLNLSENRAQAVKAYLEANMGLSADQFESIGYGESKPIASNDSPDGRRLNRRIEIIIDLDSGQSGD